MFTDAIPVGIEVDPEKYHSDLGKRGTPEYMMTCSALIQFMECPQRWLDGYQPPDSEAKRRGSMSDYCTLTPNRWRERYVVHPETYPVSGATAKKMGVAEGDQVPWSPNAKFCRQWKADQRAAGKEVIDPTELVETELAARKVHADPLFKQVLDRAAVQFWVKAKWHDSRTGLLIPVQILIDIVPHPDSLHYGNALADLKTTRNAHPDKWRRWVFQMGYHVQAALYLDVFNAATGDQRDTWLHLVQENYPPFQVGRRFLSQRFLNIGRMFYQAALARYCMCLKENKWPNYETEDSDLPGWSKTEPEPWMEQSALALLSSELDEEEEEEQAPTPEEKVDLVP